MTIEDLPGWAAAITNLRSLHEQHGAEARRRSENYAARYAGDRAAMVFDVVASRQRRYRQRVEPMVEKFSATSTSKELATLAATGPAEGYGLRTGEAQTMQQVAQGLLRYIERHGVGEEEGVSLWAASAEPFEHAPRLEPYVGHVKGIGPALFAYLRMRCGADAIKPDLRVRNALVHLGFSLPNDEHAILVVAHAAAATVEVGLLELDQLLRWLDTDESKGLASS